MKALPLLCLALSLLASPVVAADAPPAAATVKSVPPLSRAAEYRARAERELRENILPFWMQHTVDRERGGFHGEISNDLVIKQDAIRGSLLTSRVLWTFSAAYRRYKSADYLDMARWAYRDLVERFWDTEFGGVYWTATAEGKPVNQVKQVYGQAFALYALSEYHRATGDREALDRAVRIYQLLEEHARDRVNGGYFEACTRQWKRETNPRRSAMETTGPKSQNTHLHVLEAFTNLYRAWPDAGLRESQASLVEIMLTRILDPKSHHLVLFLSEDWKPITDEISFGHDIEAAWLLTEAAEVLGDEALLRRIKPVALEIARVTLRQGVDRDGSLLYEADPGGVTRSDREWWPQAEAVVGFLNAHQLGGDPAYLTAAYRVWDYIEAHLVDKEHGEWYRAVSKTGRVARAPKVSLWKCPYHNGRACMEAVERLEKLSAR